MRRPVVPDHDQRLGMLVTQLLHAGLLRRVEGGGGTTCLLESQSGRTFLAQVFSPVANRMGVPLQRFRYLGG